MVMDLILSCVFLFLFLAMIGMTSRLNEQEYRIRQLEAMSLFLEKELNERASRTPN